jgi:hypothetical protein
MQTPGGFVVVTAVLADDHLFAGTVASNVRLASPTAGDDDIGDLLTSRCLDRGGLDPSTRIGVLVPATHRLPADPDALGAAWSTVSLD